ncbi:putative gti1/Pac2 family protein [Lyophyllum shimeji]|uniref:Gti1/Pac2 family protein n=1 Tax=Lyophyllum shimeji TaxID=47721 RepID=A0A9P3UJW6_LYOSH|nr:putative gti1/Pac2 family protein [Lyophyllum shimeji]
MVTRRLDNEERGLISSGSVYVWEERGPHAELTGVGIERWTDGIRWGPSRVREGFLFYHEKKDVHSQHLYSGNAFNSGASPSMQSRSILVKQTYTVYVDTPVGQRKWHLIAYFTEESIEHLRSIDDFPHLANLTVPSGKYKSARSAKGRPDHIFNTENGSPEFPRLEYIAYTPRRGSMSSPRTAPDTANINPRRRTELPAQSRYRTSSKSGSVSSDDFPPECLAPLEYLQNMAPPRRHPIDEKTLKLFSFSRML